MVALHVLVTVLPFASAYGILRWRWFAWLHVPLILWAASVPFVPYPCPFTDWEKSLRAEAALPVYEGHFLQYYVYEPLGIKGVLKEGGRARRSAVEQSAASIGGTIEAFYFAFGQTDTYTIIDLPSNAHMAALAGTIGAAGAVKIETVVVLTPVEVDEAAKTKVSYRAPGA